MVRLEPEFLTLQSLLDRVVDHSRERGIVGALPADEPTTRTESIRRYKEGVMRDLEWLLNTRRRAEPLPEGCHELRDSVFEYGLPDITAMGFHSSRDREQLLRLLESTIRRFEPRITSPKVVLEPVADSRALRFRVDGMLRVHPAPEPVSFRVLQLSTMEYEVK
jgi:type VI secretion system protein ImpF